MVFSQGTITTVNANLASGTATAGSTVGLKDSPAGILQSPVAVYGYVGALRTITFYVTGTWTGTLVLQESLDGVNWYTNGNLTPKAGGGSTVASLTANGAFSATFTGAVQVRVTASLAITGTANVAMRAGGLY